MAASKHFSELPFAGKTFGNISDKLSIYIESAELIAALIAGLVLLTGYFLVVHYWKRPRPTKWSVKVEKLPDWISPSALRYVMQKGFDTKCILVCLLNASAKGCYQIRWAKKGFMALRKQDADFSLLNEDERRVLLALYPNVYREKFFVTQVNSKMTRTMSENMDQYYKSFRRFFRKKKALLAAGFIASVFVSAAIMIAAGLEKHLLTWMLFELALWVFVILPVFFFSLIFRDRYWFGIAYCFTFIVIGIFVLFSIEMYLTAPLLTPVVLLPVLLPMLFMRRVEAYTESGQRMVNMANAYKESLKRRIEAVKSEGGDLMDLAEEMPFILALDLEESITPYFDKMLSRTKYEPFQIFDRIYRM